MPFAENLDFCMSQKSYSAYRLAKILGVNNQSVLNWQHGERLPHTKTRIKIAQHFGITLEELDGDDLPVPPGNPALGAKCYKGLYQALPRYLRELKRPFRTA